jgi:peptidoglycan DL-endopeptidase CwlO
VIRKPGLAPYVLAGIVALSAVPAAFADPGSVAAKRAEADQVMGQLQTLSDQLERARSQYDAATAQLLQIRRNLAENRHALAVDRHNLTVSRRVIAQRLVTLYTSPGNSALEVILGARSLDEMINGLESAQNVTSLDDKIAGQIKTFRTAIDVGHAHLVAARARQRQVVAERRAAKQSIESKITEQNRLLASIKGQIVTLIRQEQERQLQMEQAAEERAAAAEQAAKQAESSTVVGISAIAPNQSTVAAPPAVYGSVVQVALSQLGVPYVWGGSSPGSGFDCSGLVMWAFAQIGVSLPHSTYAQYAMGVPVSESELEPGDLVFFDGVGHVGIYIGSGEFVEAPHTGDVVKISSLSDPWYAANYVGARRIL